VALFALANAAGRMAAALGPALFSIVMLAAGQQVAMLLILLVFACGVGIILSYVRRESRLEEKPAIPPAQ
jgi:MFS-type transporter involved in bile tolerance (Atg22 family)